MADMMSPLECLDVFHILAYITCCIGEYPGVLAHHSACEQQYCSDIASITCVHSKFEWTGGLGV